MKEMRYNKNDIIILALFVFAGIVSWNLFFKEYRQQDTVNIHEFPKKMGQWTSKELTITEQEYAILETRNAFARRYKHPEGQKVDILIVYSQHNRKVSHPPEICYTGSGVNILGNESVFIEIPAFEKVIKANKLFLEQGDVRHLSFYWFKIGSEFTSNYWKQQMLIALKTIMNRPASSALIRMSLLVDEEDDIKATKTIEEFTQNLYPHLLTYLP